MFGRISVRGRSSSVHGRGSVPPSVRRSARCQYPSFSVIGRRSGRRSAVVGRRRSPVAGRRSSVAPSVAASPDHLAAPPEAPRARARRPRDRPARQPQSSLGVLAVTLPSGARAQTSAARRWHGQARRECGAHAPPANAQLCQRLNLLGEPWSNLTSPSGTWAMHFLVTQANLPPRFGRNPPSFVRIWVTRPNLLPSRFEFGRSRPKFGRILGRLWPKQGRNRSSSVEIGSSMSKAGTVSTNIGPFGSARFGLNLTDLGPSSANFGQLGPALDKTRPNSRKPCMESSTIGPNPSSTKFGST